MQSARSKMCNTCCHPHTHPHTLQRHTTHLVGHAVCKKHGVPVINGHAMAAHSIVDLLHDGAPVCVCVCVCVCACVCEYARFPPLNSCDWFYEK